MGLSLKEGFNKGGTLRMGKALNRGCSWRLHRKRIAWRICKHGTTLFGGLFLTDDPHTVESKPAKVSQ